MNESDQPAESVSEAGKELSKGARTLRRSAEVLDDESDRRTSLAADRTVLAAERTYAAWVRTGLAALVSGVGARAVLKDALPMWVVRTTASVLILFAAFCLCAAIWRELYSLPAGRSHLTGLPRWMIMPVNAFLVLVTMAALVGVWVN